MAAQGARDGLPFAGNSAVAAMNGMERQFTAMLKQPGGRPCSVCSNPDRPAIEAMAGTLSQAAACRRYGIAKGSMSRHMAAHTAAALDALDGHPEATPPIMVERTETDHAALIVARNPVDTPPPKRSETLWPPSGIGQTPSIGARCSRCGGSTWWRREADGFTACMACKPLGGRYLPPGIAFITT